MTHIIFAGDSFSANNTDNFDIDNLKDFSFYIMHNVIHNYEFFGLDLINQKKNYNIKIHTIARASYGNHVISDKFKNKVIQIQKEYPNDKIYGIIQLSGLIRDSQYLTTITDINIKNYPYDYIDKNYDYIDEKKIFESHFDNIEKLDLFCKSNDIETYMYFGWSNIFQNDIHEYNLFNQIERIKKIVDFQKYDDIEDEIYSYCVGKKPGNKKDNTFIVNGDLYGGLTEYSRIKLPLNKRYLYKFDPHPNTASNYIFYKDKIKKWLISKNIIDDTILSQEIENKINIICEFEYNIFNMLYNYKEYSSTISNILYLIIEKKLLSYTEKYKEIFYNLNNNFNNDIVIKDIIEKLKKIE